MPGGRTVPELLATMFLPEEYRYCCCFSSSSAVVAVAVAGGGAAGAASSFLPWARSSAAGAGAALAKRSEGIGPSYHHHVSACGGERVTVPS